MKSIDYRLIGLRLKEAREQKQISLEEVGQKVGVNKSTIMRWENGNTQKFKIPTLEILADFFGVSPAWLAGLSNDKYYIPSSDTFPLPDNPIKLPILGKISAGLPILAVENIEGYEFAPSSHIKKDYEYFYLKVVGDSMNLKFNENDIVLIQKQNYLENGEIGVILVNGYDATIKKFKQDGNFVFLEPMSTNSKHETQIYNIKETKIQIVGKAISYQGKI